MDRKDQSRGVPRRDLLALSAGAGAVGIAGATGSVGAQEPTRTSPGEGTTTQQAPEEREVPDFDGYLDEVSNFDGTVVDERGSETVTVDVGAPGNGGNFAFGPAAVHVDAGTTVRWEWTGRGNQHNVVALEGGFDSGDPIAEAETTFTHTFEDDGIYRYLCEPHEQLQMKGAIVVGEDYPTQTVTVSPTPAAGGDGGDGGDEGTGPTAAGDETAVNTLLVMLGLGFLSPIAFALLLRWRGSQEPTG